MNSFVKLAVVVIVVLALILIGTNVILHNVSNNESGKQYRVDKERIAERIAKGETVHLSEAYPETQITKYEKQDGTFSGTFQESNSEYAIEVINGSLYRFDYSNQNTNRDAIRVFNICFSILSAFLIGILLFIGFKIIRPFEKISSYSLDLAKGNLVAPIEAEKTGFFGRFLWGLDLLREKLESRRNAELALQKQNKTMVLSLSHDIKTPLSLIELYSKALEKGLYQDEQKKKEVVQSICAKCEDIRAYIDGIVKTTSEEFLELEVHNSEFYLSDYIKAVKAYYTDKLAMLKIRFSVDSFSDCLLSGDMDRSVEVIQNIMENAIKYGDGRIIEITFSREENCQLIHISNSGCTLPDEEIPHIFDSFWRGSNVGAKNGSGLGLYICRALMHKMDGDVYAEVREGNMIVTTVFSLA